MAKKNGGSKKKRRVVALIVLAVLIAGGIGAYLYRKSRPADPMALYETAAAEKGTVSRTVAGEGSVRERETVSLFVDRSQKIAKVAVKEGDLVTEGQVLVEYDIADDLTELTRQLAEARLYLANARLSLSEIAQPPTGNLLLQYESEITAAQKSVDDTLAEMDTLQSQIAQQVLRVQNLRRIANDYRDSYNDGEIGEEEYNTARTNYRIASEALEELRLQLEAKENTLLVREKQLEDAETRLENALDPLADPSTASRYQIQENLAAIHQLTVTRLEDDIAKLTESTVSPINGMVLSLGAVEGAVASAYAPVVELADLSRPIISYEAAEYDAPRLSLGQTARVTFSGLEQVYEGSVTKLGARAVRKESAGDDEIVVPVEITLKNGGDALRVGNSVDIEVVLEEKRGVIAVPAKALLPREGGNDILVVAEGAVHRRSVEIGLYGDRMVEITGGLAEGEWYIANPLDVAEKHIAAPQPS